MGCACGGCGQLYIASYFVLEVFWEAWCKSDAAVMEACVKQ
jgi:hypothetical protein